MRFQSPGQNAPERIQDPDHSFGVLAAVFFQLLPHALALVLVQLAVALADFDSTWE